MGSGVFNGNIVSLAGGSGGSSTTVSTGITASTTQTQGQQPLTSHVNFVTTVANNSDTVTMVPAVANTPCAVINLGANVLQIFPDTSDDLGMGANIPVSLEPGGAVEYFAETGVWRILSRTYSKNYLNIQNNFVSYGAAVCPASELTFLQGISGAASQVVSGGSLASTLKYPGMFLLKTGTDTTGRAGLTTATNLWVKGQYACIIDMGILLEALSTSGQEYQIEMGIGDKYTQAGLGTNSIAFRYNRAVDGDFWSTITKSSTGGETKEVTAVAPSASAVQKFRIAINAAGTVVRFFINGSLVATHTTTANIPSGATGVSGYGLKIEKTAGTTLRTLYPLFYDLTFLTTGR